PPLLNRLLARRPKKPGLSSRAAAQFADCHPTVQTPSPSTLRMWIDSRNDPVGSHHASEEPCIHSLHYANLNQGSPAGGIALQTFPFSVSSLSIRRCPTKNILQPMPGRSEHLRGE